mgnify:CR=1 FL=1
MFFVGALHEAPAGSSNGPFVNGPFRSKKSPSRNSLIPPTEFSQTFLNFPRFVVSWICYAQMIRRFDP